jgi:hypothetical protein
MRVQSLLKIFLAIFILPASIIFIFDSCKDKDPPITKKEACWLIEWEDQELLAKYEYHENGNLKSKTENGRKTKYEYDDEKIIAAKNDSMSYKFYYDDNKLVLTEEILNSTDFMVRKKEYFYKGDDISRIDYYIFDNGNYLLHDVHHLKYDEKGNLQEYLKEELNPDKNQVEESFKMTNIEYDDRPSPITAENNIPFHFAYTEREIMLPTFSTNNPTSAKITISGFSATNRLSYDYNESGFPTRMRGGLAVRFRNIKFKYDCSPK